MADVVYALHTFDAENEDELTFQAGERIIVLERDDQYSDGWYQGRNERGEIGLFPQSYTSSRPPSLAEEQTESPNPNRQLDTAASTPKASSGATLGPVPLVHIAEPASRPVTSLTPPEVERRDSISEASIHSRFTEEEDEDEEGVTQSRQRLSDGAAHRAALAAKVSQNAEREAQEARDLAERRKREDEERYAQSAGQTGLIDGLQLSDESDDEGADEPVESFLPLPAPLPSASAVNGHHQAAEETPNLHEDYPRPRADTDTSTYDEPALAATPAQATGDVANTTSAVSPPVTGEVGPSVDQAETSIVPPAVAELHDVDEAPRSGEQTPTSRAATATNGTDTRVAAAALSVAGAGLAGAFGAAAAHTASSPNPASGPERGGAELSESVSSSYSAQQAPATSADPLQQSDPQPTAVTVGHAPSSGSVAAPSVLYSNSVPNASPPRSNVPHTSSPLVVDTAHVASPRLGDTVSPGSTTDSPLSPGSAIRGAASPIVRWDSLPADPIDWSVENVVDWGEQKGFDENILSKFAEHEITGDVLLEMDVAMLKEIDLVAFGRRVRVYNAIKELRQRTQPGNLMSSVSTSGGFLSPGMNGSGFESPSSPAFSPAINQLQAGPAAPSNVPLAGLGLPDDVTRQAQIGEIGYPQSDQLDATTSMASLPSQYPSPAAVQPLQSALRNEVVGSEPPQQVPEQSRLSSAASSLRPRSSRRARQSDEQVTESTTEVAISKPEVVVAQDAKGTKGEKAGFFEALPSLPVPGRNRKPPPRVPSALLIDSDGSVARPRPRTTLQDRARRSTRLFSSFGGSSGSDRSPTTGQSVRSRTSNSTIAVGRDAPTAMSVKSVDPVPKAMVRENGVKVTDGNLLDKIGRPDYSGWMRKKGEQYNTWKMRFFVLKGTYLYYLKSEAEQRAKGVIDLTGYRVISDPDIRPGEYAFKITHDTQRTHYFAAAEQLTIRSWMKEILKATIFRDYSAPVVSSCDIEVLSLDAAASRSPRPPSPERRAEIQKKRYAGTNPNTLSQKDAAILMELAPGSPYMNGENMYDSVARRPAVAAGGDRKASLTSLEGASSNGGGLPPPVGAGETKLAHPESSQEPSAVVAGPNAISGGSDLLRWVNANLPPTCPSASDLSTSLRSGQLIVRLLENLSGKMSGIPDAAFEQFNQDTGSAFDPAYLDTLFSVFDYISPLASTDDVSMEDMLTGNPSRMTLLLERIRANFPGI